MVGKVKHEKKHYAERCQRRPAPEESDQPELGVSLMDSGGGAD